MADRALREFQRQNSDSGRHETSMFKGASHVNIRGGTFTMGATDKIADAMARLGARVEHGASYDAAAREDVSKCHEHTRVAIINGIHKWAHSQEPGARPLMWIYGPAGSGKTTIMQTVAETFDEERNLATSFFFSRLAANRPKHKENFIITLAHQLALGIPALQHPLTDALSDSSILTKSLVKQLDALVIGPLNKLDPAQSSSRYIFLVDGLDECNGDAPQRDILDLLERFLQHARSRVRILIASRPLSHLQSFFAQQSIGEFTQTTALDNDYQSDEDITAFLIAKFNNILVEHPSRKGLPCEWPLRSDINVLVKRASGQFIYASVVMKFIGDHGRHPDESLQTIITLKGRDNARPYEELDAVYSKVLSTIEPQNVEFVQILMGCLLLDREKFYFAQVAQTKDTHAIDGVFMIPSGTTDARINRIYPLITTSTNGMKFSHASFPEYLLDRSRSQEFFLNIRKVHCSFARHWYKLFTVHFTLYPNSGIVPNNMADIGNLDQLDPELGIILLDVINHSLEAEWTLELQQDFLAFDVQAALMARPKHIHDEPNYEPICWYGAVLWLNLTFWVEQHHFLPSADTEHIRDHIQNVIQSVFTKPSTAPTVMRTVAGLLTWRNHMNIECCWEDMEYCAFDQRPRCENLILSLSSTYWYKDLPLCEAACLWLYKILAADTAITGSFFDNGKIYADLALLYAQGRKSDIHWSFRLAVMLSKAWPSKELATFLMQNFLQSQKSLLDQKVDHKEFMMAICIYLFESGVLFLSEHQHKPGFDPDKWNCGICMLFDLECPDIELSLDPAVKPGPQPVQIAEGEIPQPLQAPLEHQFIHGVLLLWLQAWMFWLVDMFPRFFLVLA